MSLIGNYLRITPSELRRLIGQPATLVDLLTRVLDSEDGDVPADGRWLEIDEAWQGIHFLLTGRPTGGRRPLADAVLGGTPIGEELGYGPARYLDPKQVKSVAHALAKLDEEEFRSRFDAEKLRSAGIYPCSWDNGEDDIDYLADYYTQLVDFFRQVAEAGDAMLMWVD
jgi:hypothetical protein